MKNARTLTALLVIVTLGSLPVLGGSLEPLTVSPGAVDRLTGVEVRCPTFSWQAVPGAVGYEVVVYELPPQTDLAGWSLDEAVEVLFVELPAGVTGWTPELELRLARGAEHVWFVRGVMGDDATEWSAARFFRVVGGVAEPGIGLQGREGRVSSGTGTGTGTGTGRTRVAADRNAMAKRVGETKTKDVSTAMAAIRGEMPDTTGETYGVVGTSNSLDGAGLGAVNTAGGPDLVLDGSADGQTDALLWHHQLDRPSANERGFNIVNSGGGGMTLRVDGVNVTTIESSLDADKLDRGKIPDDRLAGTYSQALSLTNPANNLTGSGSGLTGVDADTLDGTNGVDFATDVEALDLVAHHAQSDEHDDRYYTETELNTSGAGGAVNWNNLAAVPPGFADGVDDEGTFNAGPGIIIDNGQVRVDSTAFTTQLSTIDGTGDIVLTTSIAIGTDGLGLISFYEFTGQDLKVAHCNDTPCTSATTATVDDEGDVGDGASITIGTDGLGLISYYDRTNGNLKVAHCVDTSCTSATTTTLDSEGDVGVDCSVTVGADGLGLISYRDVTNQDLKVAHCDDTACTSAITTAVDATGIVGWETSIAVGVDGLGLISYRDYTNSDLKVAHCSNTACTSATTTTLDSAGYVGYQSSIVIGADGLGLISYSDDSSECLKVAHCNDIGCSSATTTAVDCMGYVGWHTSIAIGADGLGLISYCDNTNNDLKVAHCNDAVCSGAATATLDSGGVVGFSTSIAIGADGLGLISYRDATNEDLKAAHLGIGVP